MGSVKVKVGLYVDCVDWFEVIDDLMIGCEFGGWV